jgi:hypothetical protein
MTAKDLNMSTKLINPLIHNKAIMIRATYNNAAIERRIP